ncbi:MAG: prepilin-type N-terminal cleavage/methylation domain-containing protein [Candidatus Omnitrophota bacterium]
MSKVNKKAFTLVEVLATTAILSLGIVMIYEAFFATLNAFEYCSHYLKIACWMDEKLWQAQNSLRHSGDLAGVETAGKLTIAHKDFNWNLSFGSVDQEQGLYKLDLDISWQEGLRKARISRSSYVLHKKD